MLICLATELLQELADFLACRYPSDFRVERRHRNDCLEIVKIVVIPLDKTLDLEDPSLDPLEAAALL
jgi:hypothetical protein